VKTSNGTRIVDNSLLNDFNTPTSFSSSRDPIFRLRTILIVFGLIGVCGCLSTVPHEISVNSTNSSQIHVIDSSNKNWTFPSPVQRIVAFNLDTIETLIMLGAGDRVIGVPETILAKPYLKRYLPNAISIGESGSANIEKITSIRPDAVIVMSSSGEKEKSQLSALNIPVLLFNCYILDDIPPSVQNLGILTGEEANATRYLNFFNTYDSEILKRMESVGVVHPTVYLEIGNDFTTAGNGSGGDSLINHIGVRNIAGNLSTTYPKVTSEWVIKNNPDYIVKTVHTYVGKEKDFLTIHQDICSRTGFSELDACKENRTSVVTSNFLYGPKGIIGQVILGKMFYPKEFRDLYIDDLVSEYEKISGITNEEKEIEYPAI